MVKVCDEVIGQMARRIAQEIRPERIVLFGSWARGQADAGSDVDLLVVEREPFGPQRSRRQEAVRIWRCLSSFRVPTDILVYSVGEIGQWKDCRQHIIARALREGRVLYESA
jgi:predicted nucleotidyltransferase